MSARADRGWMYARKDSYGYLSTDYCNKLDEFLDFAYSNDQFIERSMIKCPCKKCKNIPYQLRDIVKFHLMKYGFMPLYTIWWAHGESQNIGQCSNTIQDYDDDHYHGYTQMVIDSMNQPRSGVPLYHSHDWEEQDPNPIAKGFYDMLRDDDVPLWNGCQKWSKLQAASRLLNWKTECNVPETTYNKIVSIIKDMLPDNEQLVGNFYETKKSLKALSLPKQKIHACKNHCMLFYKETSNLTSCLVCRTSRYKNDQKKVPNLVLTYLPITERLQRLYMSKKTSKEMTWHYEHHQTPGVMTHPSDGAAWKHFDSMHPEFAMEIRNVRLGLCTDGFNPNSSNSNPYSCWPVFLAIYNLPPWMCL